MDVEMTLIGFSADKPHSRMGFTPAQERLEQTFAAHAVHVAADPFKKCIVSGCDQATQVGVAQGWTCTDHDWQMLRTRQPKS